MAFLPKLLPFSFNLVRLEVLHTFIAFTALVIISDHLSDDQLSRRQIRGYSIKQSAKSFYQCEEIKCALRKSAKTIEKGGTLATCFEYWPHSVLGPLRVFLERIKLSERLSTQLRDSLLELRLKHIDEEVVKEGC